MSQRVTAVMVLVVVASAGLAGTAGALTDRSTAQTAGTTAAEAGGASAGAVTFSNQTSGGSTVVVDSVRVPDGGFVTIHDASVTEGAVFESVVGTSAYLTPGRHTNVTVHLEESVSTGTFVAMPHRDTDGDRAYEFVATNGEADGPYTSDGAAVTQAATVTVSASVSMTDQPTDGSTVVVDRVELSEGGFVTVHDASVTEGAVFESIRGTSQYLSAGVHEDVRVELDTEVSEETTLVPMAHRDTNGNQEYDFPATEGSEDGPYATAGGSAVVDTATVTPSDTASVSVSEQATGGNAVVVDTVFLPEGGFVTVHDGTVTEGAVFESIRGTSTYLGPGLHRNVRVELTDPVDGDATLVPMAHRDTNDNQAYDFPATEGSEDGPYTADGSAVVDSVAVSPSASVSMDAQTSDGRTVVVDSVDLSEGGFVTIHDSSLFEGETFGSVLGTSEYLEAGYHEDVEITLDSRLRAGQTLVPMAHQDTNGNEQYDFVTSEGGEDGPYTAGGSAVVDTAMVSVGASLAFSDQTATVGQDGRTVTVDSVTLRDGGFVTIHDSRLAEGEVLASVVGTSQYLSAGTHENVTVSVGPGVEDGETLVAMAHRDTNGNEAYDFVASEGASDGPYVGSGGAVVDTGTVSVPMQASVEFADQETPGNAVIVRNVSLSRGGFVTIHDASLTEGDAIGSVVGTSTYLEPGFHAQVIVSLNEPLEEDQTLIAMPHMDTNGNEAYDFVASEGSADGPYVSGGSAVTASADVSVATETTTAMDGTTTMEGTTAMDGTTMAGDTGTEADDGGDGGAPGFGVGVALVALLAVAALARRRR